RGDCSAQLRKTSLSIVFDANSKTNEARPARYQNDVTSASPPVASRLSKGNGSPFMAHATGAVTNPTTRHPLGDKSMHCALPILGSARKAPGRPTRYVRGVRIPLQNICCLRFREN